MRLQMHFFKFPGAAGGGGAGPGTTGGTSNTITLPQERAGPSCSLALASPRSGIWSVWPEQVSGLRSLGGRAQTASCMLCLFQSSPSTLLSN